MKQYLLVLGKDPILSRRELAGRCDELLFDTDENLLVVENLLMENPREIPREPEQLFLDQLGGVIRMAKIMGEYASLNEVNRAMQDEIQSVKPEGKVQLGVSGYGMHKKKNQEIMAALKGDLKRNHDRNVRLINPFGEVLTSGKIFGEKLLNKGFEFIIWKKGGTFLLARTVANQNIRNYTLRDREKDFRDAKMGMLPPKLAQMILRFADPKDGECVIDPFCGSGTINIEAGILGYPTHGGDKSEYFVSQAQKNYEQMAEKFRFDPTTGTFGVSDAAQVDWARMTGVIATEGYLGENFTERPTLMAIQEQERMIFGLWKKIFEVLENSTIRRVCFCLPAWFVGGTKHSFSKKLFANLAKSSYTPLALFGGQKSYVYARKGAYVGREICVVERQQ